MSVFTMLAAVSYAPMVSFGPSYEVMDVTPGAWVANCSTSRSASAVPPASGVPPPSTLTTFNVSCKPKQDSKVEMSEEEDGASS